MIRIKKGFLAGKIVPSPKKQTVRPTKSAVREAIFDILRPVLEDATFLDIFAGSGSIGFEAISRGASQVYFVDHDAHCVKMIKNTIKEFQIEEKSCVFHKDILRSISFLKISADIIYLDPPYTMPMLPIKMENLVEALLKNNILNSSGYLLLEMPRKAPFRLSAPICIEQRFYGNAAIWKISRNFI